VQPPVAVPYVDDVPTVPEAVADEADLGRATVHGLAWTAGSCIGQQGLVVAGTTVLARPLTPGDSGLAPRVMFPALARLREDVPRVKRTYLRRLRLREVGRTLSPTVAACAAVAAVLIPADRAFSGVTAAVRLALDLVVAAAVYVGLAVVFRLLARRELRSLASTYFGRPAIT
jgi:hypothetical protein